MSLPNLLPAHTADIRLIQALVSDACGEVADELVQMAILDNLWPDETDADAPAVLDKWGAARDVLQIMAARYKGQFDFTAGDQKFSLSQKMSQCLALAEVYGKKARLVALDAVRSDAWSY